MAVPHYRTIHAAGVVATMLALLQSPSIVPIGKFDAHISLQ